MAALDRLDFSTDPVMMYDVMQDLRTWYLKCYQTADEKQSSYTSNLNCIMTNFAVLMEMYFTEHKLNTSHITGVTNLCRNTSEIRSSKDHYDKCVSNIDCADYLTVTARRAVRHCIDLLISPIIDFVKPESDHSQFSSTELLIASQHKLLELYMHLERLKDSNQFEELGKICSKINQFAGCSVIACSKSLLSSHEKVTLAGFSTFENGIRCRVTVKDTLSDLLKYVHNVMKDVVRSC